MIKRKLDINNPTGLHLRPAGNLYKMANNYKSKIEFDYKESMFNAKSILSILGACVKCGDQIELICDGEDEELAMEELSKMIEKGLGE